jgi:hypothetical protein
MDHMARPRKHRLGAIGAIGGLLIIVSQPRTIGDPERDQPHDGHGPPPGADRKREREREGKRERERDEKREGGGVPASSSICQEPQHLQSHHGERISLIDAT